MLLASSSLQTIVIVGESYYNEVACSKVAAFEDKISVRDGISREDRHSFVTERSATPPYEMIILCARLRASKLACPNVSALFLPNTCQSQPRFIQASILDQRTVRARFFPRFDTGEREERDGSPWRSAKSVRLRPQRVTPTHRSRIIREKESEFFPGTKEICFEG